jgi:hypothetical protein
MYHTVGSRRNWLPVEYPQIRAYDPGDLLPSRLRQQKQFASYHGPHNSVHNLMQYSLDVAALELVLVSSAKILFIMRSVGCDRGWFLGVKGPKVNIVNLREIHPQC